MNECLVGPRRSRALGNALGLSELATTVLIAGPQHRPNSANLIFVADSPAECNKGERLNHVDLKEVKLADTAALVPARTEETLY